jgi:hypothetical protein
VPISSSQISVTTAATLLVSSDAVAAKATAKASANAKLKALGLSDAEIAAL